MAFRSNPRPKFMGPSPWLQGAPPSALLPNPMQNQAPMMNQGPRQGMGFNPIVSQLALANNLLSSALTKNQVGFGGPGGRGILGSAPQAFPSGGPGMMRNMMMQGGPDPKRMRMGPGTQGIPPFNQRPRMPFNAANRPQNRGGRDQPQPLFMRDRNQARVGVKRTRWEEEKNKKPRETTNDSLNNDRSASEAKKDVAEDIVVSSGDEKTYDPSSPTSDVELKENEDDVKEEEEAAESKDVEAQGILQVTIQKGMKGRSVSKEGEALEEWTKEHGKEETEDWEDGDDQEDENVTDDKEKDAKAESAENDVETKQAGASLSPAASDKKNVPPTTPSKLDDKKSALPTQAKQVTADASVEIDPSSIPPYNPSNPIGRESVVPLSGLYCKLCKKFYKDQESADMHCQSKPHYDNYKKSITEKAAANLRKKEIEKKQEIKPKPILKKVPIQERKDAPTGNKTTSKADVDKDISNKDELPTTDVVAPSVKDDASDAESEKELKNSDKDTEAKEQDSEPADGVVDEKVKKQSTPPKGATIVKPKPAMVKKSPLRGRGRGRGK